MLLNLKIHPRFNKVANTTNVVPKLDNKNGNGNKNTNQINILTLVRLKPLLKVT